MAKYLVIATYTAEGMRGVLDKGGSARSKAVEKSVGSLGGKVESFYFGFGEDDVYVVADLPDHVAAAALAMNVAASGLLRTRTVPLLAPEEIDRAAQTQVSYQPPGS